MTTVLGAATDTMTVRNFVDGAWHDAADGRTTELVDPTTGRTCGTAPLSGAPDVAHATAAAAKAFQGWRDTTPSQRQVALLRLADAIEARSDKLVARRAATPASRWR